MVWVVKDSEWLLLDETINTVPLPFTDKKFVWVPSRHSVFFPLSKNMHVKLTGDSKSPIQYM